MKRFLALFSLALLYWILTSAGLLFNPPFATLPELLSFFQTREFLSIISIDLFSTGAMTLLSLGVGIFAGTILGILFSLAGFTRVYFIGILEFLRSIPSVMWVPFGIILVGIGAKSIFFITSFTITLFMASEIAYSKEIFKKSRRNHMVLLGLSFIDRIRYAHIYEVVSVAIPSARVAATIALIVVVIGEMTAGASQGLGVRLLGYQGSQRAEGLVVILILAGTLGLLINTIADRIEYMIVPWVQTKYRS